MNKKDYLNFIERVEQKAIESVTKRYNKEIKAAKEEALSKYAEKIKKYQAEYNNLSKNIRELLSELGADREVGYKNYYGSIESFLSNLEGNTISSRIINNSSFSGKVQKIVDERDKEIKAVESNYTKVYMVSKSLANAKKIDEYLVGLGFDTSSIKEDEMQYLSTDIDKSKLFVCGERK